MLLLAAASFWHVQTGVARADVCGTKTGKATTGTLCITVIRPEGAIPVSPSPGHTVNVTGNTVITATVHYSPSGVPSGEKRGCAGERLTPSGCVTWLVNNNSTLTHLYRGSAGNYTWTWGTSQYSNGDRTLSAQIKINDSPLQVNVPVSISNPNPGSFHSPIPNGGKLPTFPTAAQPGGFTVVALGDGPSGSDMTRDVADMVHAWDPQMLMYLGDVYQRGMKDEFMTF